MKRKKDLEVKALNDAMGKYSKDNVDVLNRALKRAEVLEKAVGVADEETKA